MHATIRNFSETSSGSFNIIEEFAALTPGRKMALCDSLFSAIPGAYQSAVRALWPTASGVDMAKLEKFLLLIRKTIH
jgi:hypothetical protein